MPLSSAEHQVFNQLATKMNYFHSMLRSTWNDIYAGSSPDAQTPSETQLIRLGLRFCHHLKSHHDLEEANLFSILGRRMEWFSPDHIARQQRKAIQQGLGVMASYLVACQNGDRAFQRGELRVIMDRIGIRLWQHMDQEVVELGAESMSSHWSAAEMSRIPF